MLILSRNFFLSNLLSMDHITLIQLSFTIVSILLLTCGYFFKKENILQGLFLGILIFLCGEVFWQLSRSFAPVYQLKLNFIFDFILLFSALYFIAKKIPNYLKNIEKRLLKVRLFYPLLTFAFLILWYLYRYDLRDFYLPIILFLGMSLWFYYEEIINLFKRINYNRKIIILIIFVLGLAIRIGSASWSNINLDEGNWIYDPWMIALGKIPFLDFNSREPFFFYFMSLFVKLFGTKLIYHRLVSAVISSLNILVIYALGKKLKDYRVGLLAATIFALFPYAAYTSADAASGPLFFLITSLLFYGLICLIKKPKVLLSIVLGIILGASVHISRIAIFYYATIPLVFIFVFLPRHKIKKTTIHFLFFWFSSVIGLIPIMLYFISLVGLDEFDVLYGFKALCVGCLSAPVIFLLSYLVYHFIYLRSHRLWLWIKLFIIFGVGGFAAFSFFNMGSEYYYKAKIFYNIWLQALAFLIPLFMFFILLIKNNVRKLWINPLIVSIGSILYVLLWYGKTAVPRAEIFGLRLINGDFHLVFWLLFISMFISTLYITGHQKINLKIKKDSLWWVVLILFCTPLIFYFIHVQLSTAMFKPFIVLGSLLAAFTLIKLATIQSVKLKKGFYILIICAVFFSSFFYLDTVLRDRLWSQSDLYEITEYLEEHTTSEEEIFTAGTIFSTESGRRIVYDISHPLMYGTAEVEMPDLSWIEHLPTSSELAEKIRTDVNVIIMDHRTRSIMKSNPALKQVLDDKIFIKDEKVGEHIKIFKRK